jgi:hypothetical protein
MVSNLQRPGGFRLLLTGYSGAGYTLIMVRSQLSRFFFTKAGAARVAFGPDSVP